MLRLSCGAGGGSGAAYGAVAEYGTGSRLGTKKNIYIGYIFIIFTKLNTTQSYQIIKLPHFNLLSPKILVKRKFLKQNIKGEQIPVIVLNNFGVLIASRLPQRHSNVSKTFYFKNIKINIWLL